MPTYQPTLVQVSKDLQFSPIGGWVRWVGDHFEAVNPNQATLARFKASAAVNGDEVVIKSQLDAVTSNSNSLINQLLALIPIIITDAVADVAALPVAAPANKDKAYLVNDATSMRFYRSDGAAWVEFFPNEGQLITFTQNETLNKAYILDEDANTTANAYDNHIYTFESNIVLKDNGTSSGLETKLALLRSQLETLIQTLIAEAKAGTVKKQYLTLSSAGLTGAAFAKTIPIGAIITDICINVLTPFNAEFATETIQMGAESLFIADYISLENTGACMVRVFSEVTAQPVVNFNGGAVTSGNAVIEITYTMPEV
jgi:hypothetical protein